LFSRYSATNKQPFLWGHNTHKAGAIYGISGQDADVSSGPHTAPYITCSTSWVVAGPFRP